MACTHSYLFLPQLNSCVSYIMLVLNWLGRTVLLLLLMMNIFSNIQSDRLDCKQQNSKTNKYRILFESSAIGDAVATASICISSRIVFVFFFQNLLRRFFELIGFIRYIHNITDLKTIRYLYFEPKKLKRHAYNWTSTLSELLFLNWQVKKMYSKYERCI